MTNPGLKFDLIISDDVSNVAKGGMMGHAGWRVTVHMLEPEMTTGVQDSQLCLLFILFLFFFCLFIISLLIPVQSTPHLWFTEHRRLIKDLHVTSAFFFSSP